MSRLTVAGIGPGEADYILPAVIKKMKKAHTVIAAKRILPVLKELCQDVNSEADSENNKPVFLAMGKIKDTLEQIGVIHLCTVFIVPFAMIQSAKAGKWILFRVLVRSKCLEQHLEKRWKRH